MKKWYEELYENNAKNYDKEVFAQGTIGEVDFIEKEINYNKSLKILDLGCGTGRHSIELTGRGYHVIGVDLSENQLQRAREKSKEMGLKIEFIQKDARKLDFNEEFDLIIMLCEGSFSLMETDEMNFEILKGAERALNSNGKIIFTTLNALFPLFHSVKDFFDGNDKSNNINELSFDLMTFREKLNLSFTDDSGNSKEIKCNERYYTPSEITWYLKTLNFRKTDIFGCKLGKYSRKDNLTTEDFEMLIVAEK
jgi:2-polyprenyl-3-methyl-5-hydroxy-6-metoxy-1,4-benzoquinol methylase